MLVPPIPSTVGRLLHQAVQQVGRGSSRERRRRRTIAHIQEHRQHSNGGLVSFNIGQQQINGLLDPFPIGLALSLLLRGPVHALQNRLQDKSCSSGWSGASLARGRLNDIVEGLVLTVTFEKGNQLFGRRFVDCCRLVGPL